MDSHSTTELSDRPLEEAYDVELALRFILLAKIEEDDIKLLGHVGNFLTEKMIDVAQNTVYEKDQIQILFERTFSVLSDTLGSNAFKRYNEKKNKHEGGFLLSTYEVIALGVAFNIANDTLCDTNEIAGKAQRMWTESKFTDWKSAGVNAARRLPKLIPYGRNLFKKS